MPFSGIQKAPFQASFAASFQAHFRHCSSAIFGAASHGGWCHLRRVRHHHGIVLHSGAIPNAGRRHFNIVLGVQNSTIFRRCRHYFQTSFKRHLPVRSADLSVVASVPNAI